MSTPSFDQAYNTLYKGWDRAAAQADYNAGGWQNKAGADQFTNPSSTSVPNGVGPSYTSPSVDPQKAIANALDQAKQIRQFNIDSSQPQISTLQTSKTNLTDRYKALLDSIKGDQTLAVNKATLNTNNELGRRGILGDSGAAQTAIADAQSQAAQPYESIKSQAGISQAQDENAIAAQIAALNSGSPGQAFSNALNVGSLAQQLGALNQQQTAQQQNYSLAQQNYALRQQQLAQALAQQQIQNQFTKQGLGIQGANSAAQIALQNAQLSQYQPLNLNGGGGW